MMALRGERGEAGQSLLDGKRRRHCKTRPSTCPAAAGPVPTGETLPPPAGQGPPCSVGGTFSKRAPQKPGEQLAAGVYGTAVLAEQGLGRYRCYRRIRNSRPFVFGEPLFDGSVTSGELGKCERQQ